MATEPARASAPAHVPPIHPGLWVAYCDGSAVPNPGRMGLGAVLTAPDGARHTLSIATHADGCNNESETRALIATLQEARRHGATALRVHCDNSLLVAQLTIAGTPPVVRLAALFDEARALAQAFDSLAVLWIPRHRNGEADALARAALGLAPAAASPSPRKRKRRKR